MKTLNKLVLLGTALLCFTTFSCKNSFLPGSTAFSDVTMVQGTSKQIDCPLNVKATVGGKQKIVLSWGSVQKAVKYYVYAAATPFEAFTKIGETTDLSFNYSLNPGLTRYLKVTAVTYQDEESAPSEIVKGASLACPSISSITTDTDDNGSITTIYWYMENVEEYQENVRYEVYCYNGNTQVAFGHIDGSLTAQTFYTFKDLPQNSSFDFQVIAYTTSEQNDTESSEIMNALTAAKQTPDAVSDLKASKASSLNSITLTFSLPEPSYVKSGVTAGTETFTQYPLFFKVYRRISGAADWTVVTNHLYCDGSLTGPEEGGTPIVIEQADDAVTKLQKQEKINAWFDQTYIAGTEISFTDTGLTYGTEYEYKLQSYIDNYKNSQISSDILSVSKVVSGFTAAVPSITAVWNGYEYKNPDEKDFKLSASLGFNLTWNNFGEESNYKYVLKTTRVTVPENDGDPATTIITYETFDSIESLNSSQKNFALSKLNESDESLTEDYSQEGYYHYDLFIVEKNAVVSETDDPAAFITSTSVPGTYLVTPVLALPAIEGFEIKDGFKDKVEIKWQKQAGVTYTLERYKVNKDNIKEGDVEDVVITDLTPDGTDTLIQDAAESGTRYVYTLTAASGKYKVPSTPVTAECLGTPDLVFNSETAKHDSITITWNKVLKADSYEIDFTDGTSSFEGFPVSSGDFENLPEGITVTEADNIFTCTVNKPAGYDDATVSGKTWNTSVTAKNATTNDTTQKDTDVFTLGPAAVKDLTADVAKSNNSINVSWKPVTGAKGYAVRRARCEVTAPYKELSVDVYMLPAEGGTISTNNTEINAATATVTAEKITLTDNYKVLPDTNASVWDKNQDMLAWGFPYRYTIIPLENLEEEIETDADSTDATIGGDEGIIYANINNTVISKLGSCIGYGHSVTATKSEDPRFVSITWNKPYMEEKIINPVLWFSPSGQNQWSKSGAKTNSSGIFKIELLGENRTKAFDYAISYSTEPHNTYYEEMAKLEDNAVEPANKGYAFAINLEASNIKDENDLPGMTERFDWTLWDYNERAVGPDSNSYKFMMFNNDFCTSTDDWKTIAEISKDGEITLSNNIEDYKINVKKLLNQIEITPAKKFVSGESTYDWYEGLLKVLRDYKHYAKLEASRTANVNGEEKTIYASYSDSEVYGYRNVTDTEFARAALLNMAYGFFMKNGGDVDYSNVNDSVYIDNGSTEKGIYSGNFSHSGGSYVGSGILIGKYSHTQLASNYCPQMTSVSGNDISFLKISNAQQTFYTKGAGQGFFAYKDTFNILVECKDSPNSDIATIFSGSVTPSLGWTEKTVVVVTTIDKQQMGISVTRNGTTTTILKPTTEIDEIHYYFPIQINDSKTWYLNDQTYGWW